MSLLGAKHSRIELGMASLICRVANLQVIAGDLLEFVSDLPATVHLKECLPWKGSWAQDHTPLKVLPCPKPCFTFQISSCPPPSPKLVGQPHPSVTKPAVGNTHMTEPHYPGTFSFHGRSHRTGGFKAWLSLVSFWNPNFNFAISGSGLTRVSGSFKTKTSRATRTPAPAQITLF